MAQSIALTNEKVFSLIFNEYGLPLYMKLPLIIFITTIIWLVVTFITPADDNETLLNFYKKTKPGGPGWNIIKKLDNIDNNQEKWVVPSGILCMILGCLMIYSALFSTGYFIYGLIFKAFVFLFCTIFFEYLCLSHPNSSRLFQICTMKYETSLLFSIYLFQNTRNNFATSNPFYRPLRYSLR